MSAFEFFFSFYGLLLGLSVAVIATGLATAIQHRKKIRIGWLTPLLALLVALDVASFGRENGMMLVMNYMGAMMVYAVLVVPAAFTRSRRIFAVLVGIHITIYLLSAVVTAAFPDVMGQMGYAETPAPQAGGR